MSNPSPRPALRKAADAGVHPAAPAPARAPRQPRTAVPAPVEPVAPTPVKRAKKKPGSEFEGTTSDHLRRMDAPSAPATEKAEQQAKAAKKAKRLTGGETVKLTVRVPKKLRKAAEKEAARRGLDVDAVVADLLHAWLTGHR